MVVDVVADVVGVVVAVTVGFVEAELAVDGVGVDFVVWVLVVDGTVGDGTVGDGRLGPLVPDEVVVCRTGVPRVDTAGSPVDPVSAT
jgi:hypothetical protein